MMMARSTVGNGGFAQGYLIDYNKTMAPTARLEPFRSLLHIAAILDWNIQHVDITNCVPPQRPT